MPLRFHIVALALLVVAGASVSAYLWNEGDRVRDKSSPRTGLAANVGRPLGADLDLIDQNGRQVRSTDFDGKVRLVFFGFTNCPDVCPTGLSVLSLMMEDLGAAATGVRALFITVDPERDTPAVVKDYVGNFSPEIVGLTGTLAQVDAAVKSFQAYFKKIEKADGTYVVDHTASIFLLDRAGNFHSTIDIHESPKVALAKVRRALAR